MKKIIYFIVILSASLMIGFACESTESSNVVIDESLPNIIIFVADDASWRDYGAYGNDVIKTPNIDLLAEGGMLFENAFLTTPQCSPSRISILTGLHPHATGAEDLHMPLPDDMTILPGYLSEKNYFNGHMQKTHYGPNADEQFDWYSPDLSEDFPEFLDEAGDSPFFLWVGFTDPHRTYGTAPEVNDPSDVIVPPYHVDDEPTRVDIAQYYDEITRMDGQIGLFMEEIMRRGIEENTLIIYITDNGAPFPREKGSLYDAGIKTPLIFYWPGEIEAGLRYEGLSTIIDLSPTILDITGIKIPDFMHGESVLQTLSDITVPGREYVFSQRNWHDADEHMRSLRTDRYKLIRNDSYTELPHGTPADIGGSPTFRSLMTSKENGGLNDYQSRLFDVPRPRIELYDLAVDPWEINNVAADPDYWELARELSAVLDQWMEETGDFSPHVRVRDDHTDRLTGVWFSDKIPPMRHLNED